VFWLQFADKNVMFTQAPITKIQVYKIYIQTNWCWVYYNTNHVWFTKS